MIEEWKTIDGFPGYEVSLHGRVRSPNKILLPDTSGKYLRVSLGTKYREQIHILVLEAFVSPKPGNNFQGHHKNGCRTDNNVENLEWLSSRDHGKTRRALDDDIRNEIRARYAQGGVTRHKLAKEYEVGYYMISRIVNSKRT